MTHRLRLPRPAAALALLLILTSFPSSAETLAERLDRFRAETATPGLALAAMRQGEPEPRLYLSGLGNVELDSPLSADSVFRIGSVTKLFTAILAMQLVESGQLSLDTTLDRHIPELPQAAAITVRDLLQHSSGLPDFLTLPPFTDDMARPYTAQQLLALVAKAPADFAPGTAVRYSNSGCLVLGLLIERVTGRRFADLLAERVTRPLGMTATRFVDDMELVPHRVAGYTLAKADGKPRLVNAAWISIVPPGASGGLLSRASDFVRLADLGRVLRPDTVTMMTTPDPTIRGPGVRQEATGGQPSLAMDYGLGFEVVRIGAAAPMVGKNGSIPGFAAWFLLVPERHLALAASANNETALMPLLLLLAEIANDRTLLP